MLKKIVFAAAFAMALFGSIRVGGSRRPRILRRRQACERLPVRRRPRLPPPRRLDPVELFSSAADSPDLRLFSRDQPGSGMWRLLLRASADRPGRQRLSTDGLEGCEIELGPSSKVVRSLDLPVAIFLVPVKSTLGADRSQISRLSRSLLQQTQANLQPVAGAVGDPSSGR